MKKKCNCIHFPSGKWKKPLLVMKLKLILLLCCVWNASANTLFSQQLTYDVSFENTTLVSVLGDLKVRTGYSFTYNRGAIDESARVTVNLKNATLDQILEQVLTRNGYSYEVDENRVIFVSKAKPAAPQVKQITIKGVVRDADKHPIPGVSVLIKGTTIGTATGGDGGYTLKVAATENLVLIFFSIGKKSMEIPYTGQTELNATLEDDVEEIGDVVVTGIFNRPRESYTGAVTTVTSKELQSYRGQNLIQTLRNIDPAINMLENNLEGSNPNALPEITIRGSSSLPLNVQELNEGQKYNLNTPLIIMDGFEISLTKLLDYNDDEIQSINILKDASATAIYGSRGANGVIVIISKQPTPGQLRINAKFSMELEMPDLSSYDLLDAAEKLQLEKEHGFYDYINLGPSTNIKLKEVYYQRYRDVIEGTDTYWLSKPLRTGVTHRYNIRLDGGSQEFRWGVTTAYNRVNGVMKNSYRENFNGQIMLQYQHRNVVFRNQSEVGINKGVESDYGTFAEYATMNPYYKLYDDKGMLVKNFTNSSGTANVPNPLYNATLNSINESGYTQIINNFSIEWNMAQGLTLRGKFGISKQTSTQDRFIPPGHSSYLSSSQYATGDAVLERGRYTYSTGETNSFDASVTLGYTKTFNEKHQVYAGLDWSLLQRKTYTYTFEGIGYNNDKLNSIGNAMFYGNGKPQESEEYTRSVGFTGNVNYTYDFRYFADASFRMDGSSQFGTDKRFAPFWSIGLGWNLHNEAFLREDETINTLRLKLSYGETGSQQFSAYQAMRTFKYYLDDRYGNWGGAYLMGLGNEDLKWQVTDQFNVGTEIAILNSRLTAAFDYYIKKTTNLISALEITRATGFDSYMTNIGGVKNTGFEGSLGGYLIRDTERDIAWTLNGKIAYNKNEITKLSEEIKRQTEEYLQQDVDVSTLFYEGRSQNALYAVRSLGIDPSTGQEVFLDKNDQVVYEWKPSDKVYLGENTPLYRGNISTMFRYKNLTLNLSFAYHWGGVTYNSTLVSKVEMLRSAIPRQNVDRRVLTDRWGKPGDIAQYKKIPAAGKTDLQTRASSRFVMKDRVFQLQTASVEYRFEDDWLKKAGVSHARVGLNMSDLFYISSVKRERGINYPFSRRVGASLSLMF